MDYRKLYNLEGYLFRDVHKRFRATGRISAFDFYCILVWKANRAKSQTKSRLERIERGSFPQAVSSIAKSLREAESPRERLQVLMMDWEFRLPTASAILSVLYPRYFTVYDVRVCSVLNAHAELAQWRFSEKLWDGYRKFSTDVRRATKSVRTLRDKDRYLWGKSLFQDIKDELG